MSPFGNVPKGSKITITVYGDFPTPSAPGAPTASPSSGAPGDEITISFPTYSGCPASNPLESYQFTITNATPDSHTVPAGGATTFPIELGSSGTATVAYVARCAGGITSNASSTISISITP